VRWEPGAGGKAARGLCPAEKDRGSLQTSAGRGVITAQKDGVAQRQPGNPRGGKVGGWKPGKTGEKLTDARRLKAMGSWTQARSAVQGALFEP